MLEEYRSIDVTDPLPLSCPFIRGLVTRAGRRGNTKQSRNHLPECVYTVCNGVVGQDSEWWVESGWLGRISKQINTRKEGHKGEMGRERKEWFDHSVNRVKMLCFSVLVSFRLVCICKRTLTLWPFLVFVCKTGAWVSLRHSTKHDRVKKQITYTHRDIFQWLTAVPLCARRRLVVLVLTFLLTILIVLSVQIKTSNHGHS